MINGQAIRSWTAEWQNDCNGLCNPPEWYFVATAMAIGGGEVEDTITSEANLLTYPNFQDSDGDGIRDLLDNCPNTINPTQEDSDSDKVGHACDNCPININSDQKDSDSDGIGNVCDNDLDNDGIPNTNDKCPLRGGVIDASGCPPPLSYSKFNHE